MTHQPMTVIHLIAQLRFGAGRYVVDTAVEQCLGLKHRVIVCVSRDVDEVWRTDSKLVAELAANHVEVRTIGDFFHRRVDLLHKAAGQLQILRAESVGSVIVHAHTAMAAAVGHWSHPDGLVVSCHGWAAGRPPEFDVEDSLAYQLCDSVLTYSRHWADRLTTDLGASNPVVIPMGLDLRRFPSPPRRQSSAKAPFRLVTVCELTPRKGVDLLLNAMPTVWNFMPDVELHIIGHGESAADLRALAGTLDPGLKRVKFHGAIASPFERLVEFDVFVLATRSDNLPIALLEAMLARIPIVATAVGGIPDLVASASCGLVVPPDSACSLADAIVSMLRQSNAQITSLAKNGERFCRGHFDVRKAVSRLDHIYRSACRAHSGRRSFRPGTTS